MTVDLRDTITPKSDQLNADDLLGISKTITITKVTRGDSAEQPVSVHFEGDNGKPWKPCKSMRRVMISCWGDDGAKWAGKQAVLYCDPGVKFGGVAVGGIRISHLSHIDRDLVLSLTVTKAKRAPYEVKRLSVAQKPAYPADKFTADLPAMLASIADGKSSVEKIVVYLEKNHTLSDEQRAQLTNKETTA